MHRTQSSIFVNAYRLPKSSLSEKHAQSHHCLFDRTYCLEDLNDNASNQPLHQGLYAQFQAPKFPVKSAAPVTPGTSTKAPSIVGTYEIPIIGRGRSESQIYSPTDGNYRSMGRTGAVHRQPGYSTGGWLRKDHTFRSEPSIIACLDVHKLRSDEGTSACTHEGANWEDCRITIHCFGLGLDHRLRQATRRCCTLAGHRRQGPTHLHTLPPSASRTYVDSTLTAGKRYRRERWTPIAARSVRLTIIPLNPIYRRKLDTFAKVSDPNVTEREALLVCNLRKPNLRSWYKRIIQKMAFKIDDFTIQEDQIKTAKDVFKRYDKRGQDKISTTDLGPAFRALNLKVKPDTLKEWADQVDDDATGFIDFNGFLICYGKSLQEEQDERDLRDAFRVLDKNKRGEIDVEDLRWILQELGDDLTEEEIDDMIRDTDTDGSGFVDFDEFYKLMTSE